MIQDKKLLRLQEVYKFLYVKGLIKGVTDFSKKLKRARPGVSNALNGKEGFLTDSFLAHVVQTFPIISYNWLMNGEGEMIKEDKPEQPAPAPSSSQSDAIIDIYAHLISDLETMRAQTLQTLNEARAMKSEIEDLRHDYLDALARLERAISNIDSLDTPSIGIAAEDTKRGCS